MRTLNKNKQKLYYALFQGITDAPALDEQGHIKTMVVDGQTVNVLSGDKKKTYYPPVEFMANIVFGGGNVADQEYGVDIKSYDAVLICNKGEIPVTETSLIWYGNEPVYLDADRTIVDANSATFRVKKINVSLNELKVILAPLVNSQ